MKKYIFSAILLLFALAASAVEPTSDPVDLGIVLTREDGTTYKLYWAQSNLSASGLCAHPEDFGNYYAWGETAPKSDYSWNSYGTVDKKPKLELKDDVAHVILGGNWRMPTDAEWTALRAQCTWTWTTLNGVNGRLVKAPNGNSIFLPAAGHRRGTSHFDAGAFGYYWTASLRMDFPSNAFYSGFGPDIVSRGWFDRYYGFSIRPVTEQ